MYTLELKLTPCDFICFNFKFGDFTRGEVFTIPPKESKTCIVSGDRFVDSWMSTAFLVGKNGSQLSFQNISKS